MIPQSTIEIIAFITGLGSVWLASRHNIWTWFLGIVNALCLFYLFREVQLYSDQILQLFFIGTNIYGAYLWNSSRTQTQLRIKTIRDPLEYLLYIWLILGLTWVIGSELSQIHIYFPNIKPTAYPYMDTFIAVSSIIATIGLARKVLENWLLWILIDIICVYIYYRRGLELISLQYLIFGIIASYGFKKWNKK